MRCRRRKRKDSPMPSAALDLPDPLDNAPKLPLDNADELISRLAGEDIDRLLGPDAPWEPQAPPASDPLPPKLDETPVEELAAQLDQVFEEIRLKELSSPPLLS